MTNFYIHETAVIDKNCSIGKNTKIWHFSHIMNDSRLGDNCNIGQNVVGILDLSDEYRKATGYFDELSLSLHSHEMREYLTN